MELSLFYVVRLGIVQTLEKISKQCVVHLTTEKIEFIYASETTDGIQVWAGMNVVCIKTKK